MKLSQLIVEEISKYMQPYYVQKCSSFSRYALYDIDQLIELGEWKTAKDYQRNIKYLYQNVDAVKLTEDLKLASL